MQDVIQSKEATKSRGRKTSEIEGDLKKDASKPKKKKKKK